MMIEQYEMSSITAEKYNEWRSALAESRAMIAIGNTANSSAALYDIKRAILTAEAKKRAFFAHLDTEYKHAKHIKITESGKLKIKSLS